MIGGLRLAALLCAALATPTGALADVTPRTVEVTMSAVVRQVTGGGVVRRTGEDGAVATRTFDVSELPDFPLARGAAFALGWRASGAGFEAFFDEEGLPICQPFLLGGVSAGPPRGMCTNAEARALVLFTSLPFSDRLADEPVAQGPNIYLGDYSLDLAYVPSTFLSAACCSYEYDWDDGEFSRVDTPGIFKRTGAPHAAEGAFIGSRGQLDYRFDIDGDDVEGIGAALIQFDVDWRFRNYTTTSVPAPSGLALFGLSLAALALRRSSRDRG